MAEPIIETHSQTWRAVKGWAETRIEQHRARLEAIGTPEDETEQLRGAIRDLRTLLKLPEPKINASYSTEHVE